MDMINDAAQVAQHEVNRAVQAAHQVANPAGGEFLTFRLGAEEYGIDILRVQEIRSYEQPTRIANAPVFIKGVVNLRGTIVPIVDLRVKLGCEKTDIDSFTVVIVLNAAMLGTLTPVAAIDGKEFNRLLTLNLIAQQALIANFDPLLRRAPSGRLIALSSGVAREPRAYWGAYAASKAAFEVLVSSYGAEMRNISTVRTAILDPGGTRTQMRARAYPGEDPQSIKDPAAVGEYVAKLMVEGFDSTAFHALPKVMEKA